MKNVALSNLVKACEVVSNQFNITVTCEQVFNAIRVKGYAPEFLASSFRVFVGGESFRVITEECESLEDALKAVYLLRPVFDAKVKNIIADFIE